MRARALAAAAQRSAGLGGEFTAAPPLQATRADAGASAAPAPAQNTPAHLMAGLQDILNCVQIGEPACGGGAEAAGLLPQDSSATGSLPWVRSGAGPGPAAHAPTNPAAELPAQSLGCYATWGADTGPGALSCGQSVLAMPAPSPARWPDSGASTVGGLPHSTGDPGRFSSQCGQEAYVGGAPALPHGGWGGTYKHAPTSPGQAHNPECSGNASSLSSGGWGSAHQGSASFFGQQSKMGILGRR